MQVSQGSLKTLDFPLVVNLLALGQFQGFEHLFHFVEGVLEFLNYPIYLLDGIADGGRAGRGRLLRFRALVGYRLDGRRRWLVGNRLGGFSGRRRRFRSGTFPAARVPTSAAARTAPASSRSGYLRLPGSTFVCFVWRHKHRLPRAS